MFHILLDNKRPFKRITNNFFYHVLISDHTIMECYFVNTTYYIIIHETEFVIYQTIYLIKLDHRFSVCPNNMCKCYFKITFIKSISLSSYLQFLRCNKNLQCLCSKYNYLLRFFFVNILSPGLQHVLLCL